jgi:hypothetical protein
MSDNFTHRNHYLPEQYQFGFANKNKRVWIFDRKEHIYREGNSVNIAVKRDFYTTIDPTTGVESDSVEKMFTNIEKYTWPVIDQLDQQNQMISDEGRAYLALFVAFLMTRTPAFDQFHNNTSDLILRWWAKARNPTVEAVAKSLAQAKGEPVQIAEAQKAFEMIHNGKYEVKFPRQNAIKTMLSSAAELGEAIASMDWTIYTCPDDCTLITSDNPFVVIPPQDLDLTISGFGPLMPGAISLIPLNKRTLMCAQKDSSGLLKYKSANRDIIRFVNYKVVAKSDRFIIARDEPLLRKLVKRTKVDQWQNTFTPSMMAPDSNLSAED